MTNESKNVKVVVLGDIGRSPRMQYHSLSLAEMGHKVDIIGYGETEPMDELKKAPLLYYHYMAPCLKIPNKLLNYAFKTIWQALNLLFLLIITRKPDVLMVQNPPAIPSLIVCWAYARIVRAKFIIDWHNYAYTIMALSLNREHLLVKITKSVESFIGSRADSNFCVSKAMKNDLKKFCGISAITLYDRPPLIFKSISLEEKDKFLKKLGKTYVHFMDGENTIFTETIDGKAQLKNNRPGFLISSTSWTEDEDFAILFAALQEFENHIQAGNHKKLPKLTCLITGKGHLKEYYLKKIQEQNWKNVTVITPWLESEDYPLALASADLGVCLHTSSSGVDLPMKVVDMFGCGLPVCAYNYNCLSELVTNNKNGYTFNNSEELSKQLQDWFKDFPNSDKQNDVANKFREEIKTFQNLRWNENWKLVASHQF